MYNVTKYVNYVQLRRSMKKGNLAGEFALSGDGSNARVGPRRAAAGGLRDLARAGGARRAVLRRRTAPAPPECVHPRGRLPPFSR